MKKIGILTAALILMITAGAYADEILLKNGSRMTGTITMLDTVHVKIKTAYGSLDVPRADIRSAVIGEVPPGAAADEAIGASSGTQPNTNPVAVYALDGNAQDSSGNHLNGTLKGSPVWKEDRFGKKGGALSFRGRASDRVEIKDHENLNPEKITISAWVTGENPRLWARIINKYHHGAKKGYALIYNHKKKTLAFDAWREGGKGLWVETRHKLEKGWQHVCVTYDGTLARIYYNGKMEAERKIAGVLRHTEGPLTIGSGNDGNCDFPWSGRIDDVRIYNRGLSSEEVVALYKKRAESPSETDLTGKDSI